MLDVCLYFDVFRSPFLEPKEKQGNIIIYFFKHEQKINKSKGKKIVAAISAATIYTVGFYRIAFYKQLSTGTNKGYKNNSIVKIHTCE